MSGCSIRLRYNWPLAQLMIKPMMHGVIRKLLHGLAYHFATGETVDTELPPKEGLQAAIG